MKPQSKTSVILNLQELSRSLVLVDKDARRKGFKRFSRALSSANLSPGRYKRIWHIVLRCYWLCDKHVFHTELAVHIALLTRNVAKKDFPTVSAAFFEALGEIWFQLDGARLPKFERLIRIFQAEVLDRIRSEQWEGAFIKAINDSFSSISPLKSDSLIKNKGVGVTLCYLATFTEELLYCLSNAGQLQYWNGATLLLLLCPIIALSRSAASLAVANKSQDMLFGIVNEEKIPHNLSTDMWYKLIFELVSTDETNPRHRESLWKRLSAQIAKTEHSRDSMFNDVVKKIETYRRNGVVATLEEQILAITGLRENEEILKPWTAEHLDLLRSSSALTATQDTTPTDENRAASCSTRLVTLDTIEAPNNDSGLEKKKKRSRLMRDKEAFDNISEQDTSAEATKEQTPPKRVKLSTKRVVQEQDTSAEATKKETPPKRVKWSTKRVVQGFHSKDKVTKIQNLQVAKTFGAGTTSVLKKGLASPVVKTKTFNKPIKK